MAYDPYQSASAILNLKGEWDAADEENRKKIAQKAQKHYDDLIGNGYGGAASKLQNSNYAQAKGVVNGIGKAGKTQGRDYLVDSLAKYGLTKAQANKEIGWDSESGDVTLGSVNVGKGDVLIDGRNYYSDTSVLDNAVKEYARQKGLKVSDDVLYNQGVQDNNERLRQDWEIQLNKQNVSDSKYADYHKAAMQSPSDSAYWNDIVDSFMALGDKAGYNEIANGAGSNGGNVDSFSQANANRQLAAFRSQGVLAANAGYKDWLNGILTGIQAENADDSVRHNNRMNNAQMQMQQNQQVFDNSETAKNNAVDRNVKISEVTGVVPGEWLYSGNPYFNGDGTLKEEYKNFDFKNAINQAVARGDEAQANLLRVARGAKMAQNWEEFGQYDDGDWSVPTPMSTATVNMHDAELDNERYASDNALKATKYTTDSSERTTKYGYDTEAQTAKAQIDASERINKANNDHEMDMYKEQSASEAKEQADGSAKEMQENLDALYDAASDSVKSYIRDILEPMVQSNVPYSSTNIQDNLLANADRYRLRTSDMKEILRALNCDYKWVDDYVDKAGGGVAKKSQQSAPPAPGPSPEPAP